MWRTLRPQIKTLLETVNGLHEVSGTPKLVFSGYPAAYIVPAENENAYETNKENIRTYAFIVRLFYDTKNSGIGTAIEALEQLVDSVIDLFDQEDLKTSTTRTVGVNLPSSDYQFINIWATPSLFGEVPDEQLAMAEVMVRVRISVDIS